MYQTVYVLGAGASFGDVLKMSDEQRWKQVCTRDRNIEIDQATATNPPLITGFFNAKHLWWTYPERIEQVYPEMIAYVRRGWGVKGKFGTEDWLNVNLEDVFTSAAIDVEFNPVGTNAHAKSQLLLNQIKRHASFVLGRATICRYGEHTRALVNALHESDTIINFNYDLLVDQELIGREGLHWYPREDAYQYHNFADVILDKPFNDSRMSKNLRERSTGSGLYLKMHGSMNWTTCSNTSCPRSKDIEIDDVFMSLLLRNSPTGGPPICDTCKGGEVSIVLVPPLLNKPVMHLPVFRNIWSNALYALKQAQKVVIIGYSFPSTDFYTEWLFRSARIDDDTQVLVVNPLNDPDHPNQKERERFVNKARSLFRHGYNSEFTRFDQLQFGSS